jgi:uncharacterized membrane protein
MVIMALDHTRDFMSELRFAPEDLARTYGALFFTRFITHYCAPVYAFLAGTGAFLSTKRGKSMQQVSRFFLTRGLWLANSHASKKGNARAITIPIGSDQGHYVTLCAA